MARAILRAVPEEEPGLEFRDLPDAVGDLLEPDELKLKRLGSIAWYTTTVKLDLEVKGALRRVKGSSPQRLVRSPRAGV